MIELKQKQIIIAIFFATALLLASPGCFSATNEKTKAALAGEEFVFTFWPVNIDRCYPLELEMIDTMMSTEIGMTYAGISFRPYSNVESCLTNGILTTGISKYKVALEISAGHYDSSGGRPELVDTDATGKYLNTNDGNQFLKAPCLCKDQSCDITSDTVKNNWSDFVDQARCEGWNNTNLAIDPSYTGTLWENTVKNTEDIIKTANPDIVLFDVEHWQNPNNVKNYFTTSNSNCVCSIFEGETAKDKYYKYYESWKERYSDLRDLVKNINQSTEVYFFGDIKAGGGTWTQDFDGRYVYLDSNYLSVEAGDYPNPNYYVLPNLELLEKNTANDLSGAVPWVSFVYMTGHSNYFDSDYYQNNRDEQGCSDLRGDIRFDTSVSREAGRMLRKAGARGFMVYPNKETYNWGGTCPNNSYGDYWLDHSREMIEGFKEGGDYIEKNKIKNPGFESWKVKSDSTEYDGTTLIEEDGRISARLKNERFIPVFWSWIDSNPAYNDSGVYADLTTDEQSGMYSWRHTRTGDIGTRAINSRTFPITSSEAGNYSFSIQTKASIDNSNGKIEFYLVNTNTSEKQDLGYTGFARDWTEFKKDIGITAGDYNIKIILNDQTGQTVDVFLDTVSFEKAEACGNGECEAALGETTGTCPADCPPECVDTFTLMNQYIPQWKRGEITMLTLMQKMKLWDAGTGCPPE